MIRTEDCFRRRSKVAEVVAVDSHRRRNRNRNLGSSEGNLTSLKRFTKEKRNLFKEIEGTKRSKSLGLWDVI